MEQVQMSLEEAKYLVAQDKQQRIQEVYDVFMEILKNSKFQEFADSKKVVMNINFNAID